MGRTLILLGFSQWVNSSLTQEGSRHEKKCRSIACGPTKFESQDPSLNAARALANLSLTFPPANSYSDSLHRGGGSCSNASFTYLKTAPPFAASCSRD